MFSIALWLRSSSVRQEQLCQRSSGFFFTIVPHRPPILRVRLGSGRRFCSEKFSEKRLFASNMLPKSVTICLYGYVLYTSIKKRTRSPIERQEIVDQDTSTADIGGLTKPILLA